MKYHLLVALALGSLLFGCLGSSTSTAPPSQLWGYAGGLLWVAQNRGPVDSFGAVVVNDTPQFRLTELEFSAIDNTTIYALIGVPKANGTLITSNAPGIVFMPGAGVSKWGAWVNAMRPLVEEGFVVISFDARGVNDTGGATEPLAQEEADFEAGNLSQMHLQIIDYLRAYDLLREQPEVNASRILFMGESNGGRNAIIAGALDNSSRGVLVISTAGYGEQSGSDPNLNSFVYSVDPDNYIGLIAPRPIVFMHSLSDPGIPYAAAQATYSYANPPKQFITIPCTTHGYCDLIQGLLYSVASNMTS